MVISLGFNTGQNVGYVYVVDAAFNCCLEGALEVCGPLRSKDL